MGAITSTTTLTLPAPAKINRFLHITGRRADGYHTLQTIFQFLDYGDTLSFNITREAHISVCCEHPQLKHEGTANNLIFKAAQKLQAFNNSAYQGVEITLDKVLPLGGGLGGGSSNAATTLIALNILWQINLPLEQLLEIGRELGADIPIFLFGQTAWAEGIGEQLTAIDIENPYFLVVKPPCHVKTSEIFLNPQLTRGTQTTTIADFKAQGGHNDCEALVRKTYPEVDKALIWLSKFAKAQLTGTGACVFASFNSLTEAQAVLQQMPENFTAFVAPGSKYSKLHKTLAAMQLLTL